MSFARLPPASLAAPFLAPFLAPIHMTRTLLLAMGVASLAPFAAAQQVCSWDLPIGFVGNTHVASISMLEHEVILGYPFRENASGWAAGRVQLVYRGLNGVLNETGWLDSPSPGVVSLAFGTAIARDGDHLAVTCPGERPPGSPTLGAIFTFRQNASLGWDHEDTILAPSLQQNANFGASTALGGDWLFVGAPNRTGVGTSAGAVRVYQNSPGGWNLTQTLRASNASDPNRRGFGYSMAFNSGRLVVGSYAPQATNNGSSGAYLFEESGGTWTETLRIDGITGGGTNQAFGQDVAISGNLMVIGAPGHAPTPGSTARGAAAVWRLDPQTGWTSAAVLQTEPFGVNESYGAYVGVDRGRVLVAASEADGNGVIEVWGQACGDWHQSHRFGSPSSGGVPAMTTTHAGIAGDVVVTTHATQIAAHHLTCTLGRSYCDPNTENATGLSGRLRAEGSTTVTDNALTLAARQLPPMSAGLILFSQTPIFTPVQSCTMELCLGGTIARGSLQALFANASGEVNYSFDTSSLPPIVGGGPVTPGDTWYCQYIHRNPDPALPLALTNAVSVTFQ